MYAGYLVPQKNNLIIDGTIILPEFFNPSPYTYHNLPRSA